MSTTTTTPPFPLPLTPPPKHPHRHLVVFLCFLSFIICNIDRVNISVSIIPISALYNYTPTTQGLILSSFFYGYATTQILGGHLADKHGGRTVLAAGVFIWSIMTILTPIAASMGLWSLIVVRVLMGVGEGVAMPAMNSCVSYWVPVAERARSLSWIYSGMYFGSVVGFLGSTKIIERWRWEVVFYIFGTVGVVWTGVWLGVVKRGKDEGDLWEEGAGYGRVIGNGNGVEEGLGGVLEVLKEKGGKSESDDGVDEESGSHRSHDNADEDDEKSREREALAAKISPESTDDDEARPPLSVLMTNKVVWVIILAHLTSSYGFFVLLTWLPTFFHTELGLNFRKSSLLSATPYVFMFIFANIGGYIADKLVERQVSITNVRRLMQTIGFAGPAIFLMAVASTSNAALGVTFCTCALALSSFSQSGVYSSHQDIGPKCAGILLGISNTFATLPGIVGVALTGFILDVTDNNWTIVFAIPIALYIIGMVVYNLGITGERIF